MDPALQELIANGAPGDEVAVIVRLREGAACPRGLRLVARFGSIATGRADRGDLSMIYRDPGVASLKAPRDYAGEPAPALAPRFGRGDVALRPGDLRRPADLPETGRGTILAVIDWGIDFAHPDFRKADGSTRLLALWDQRARPGGPPYGYGRIHTRDAINAALRAGDPFAALPYRPAASGAPAHGTHVMGIAAGNGAAGGPAGIAPEADLLFVHLGPGIGDLGNSVDLLEAIHFVIGQAGDRPVAINLSIGRIAGPHDGRLLLEQAIDWLIVARPGTVVVQSTGNYWSKNTHMEGRLHETRVQHLPFRMPASDPFAASVEAWYSGADEFTAEARGPDGSIVRAAAGQKGSLVDRTGREIARLYHRVGDPNNGDNLVNLVLRPMAPAGDWQLSLTGVDVIDGRWHAWIERNAANPRAQGQFAGRLASRRSTTGSICNARRTIAVGAYDAHDPAHALAPFSSEGPTRDGRPKPLCVAPGRDVLSVASRPDAAWPPRYVRMSGTSMAAPHVTGTAALMLQAAGMQPIAAIRRALFAALSPAPGKGGRWGYGLLDTPAAVAFARALRAGIQPRASPFPGLPDPEPDEGLATFLPPWSAPMPERSDDEQLPDPVYRLDESAATPAWTKGHDQRQPTTVQRALAAVSDADLRRAVEAIRGGSAPAAPMLVAMREDAEDAAAMLRRAGDPFDPGAAIVAWPGRRLQAPLLPGDLIVTGAPGGPRRATMIADPALLDRSAARATGADGRAPGRYVAVIGDRGAERVTGPDGLVLPDVTILRAAQTGESVAPPDVARPTIRTGSRGPAVSEAQARLNAHHVARMAAGLPGLERCPLLVDGIFGNGTRAAVVSFQRAAFPGAPNEWDGVVGPRSWAALLAGAGEERQGLPTTCPGLPLTQTIDNFDFGDDHVLPRHQPQIVGIARCVIASQRTRTPVTRLRAIGHTDPVGNDSDNDALGLRRAEAIKREILEAIRRMTGRASTLAIGTSTRGEREPAGDPGASRRVVVESDFVFPPPSPPTPPASTATVEFVLDDDGDHRVDGRAPVATALMFGLWDAAYDASGNIVNGAAETGNFVGLDRRRFYIRVTDSAATGSTVTARWRTLDTTGANLDAPASQDVTLTETASGSHVYVSRALMLVTDTVDAAQATHSGLTAGPDAGVRTRGQSNHRLRRGVLDGSVRADYTPAGGGSARSVTLPVFQRTPVDLRRRLPVKVVHFGLTMTPAIRAQIAEQFARANSRWMQTGLRIDPAAGVDVAIPAAARDANGVYVGSGSSAPERTAEAAALRALIDAFPTATPGVMEDNYVAVCFTRLPTARNNGHDPFNAYATLNPRPAAVGLGDRYFIFIHHDVDPNDETLGHELHHVIHNRGDDIVNLPDRQFFTFATNNPLSLRLPLPDARIYRRIQLLHGDPNADPNADSIHNWMRRRRTIRFNATGAPIPDALAAADATTGNRLTVAF